MILKIKFFSLIFLLSLVAVLTNYYYGSLGVLPIDTLKIHHLQIVKHTMMAFQFKNNPEMFSFMELDEYIDLIVSFLELLNPKIIVERFFSESPERMLIHPKYGLKNFEVKHLVEKCLEERDTYQGKLFQVSH